MRIHEGIIGIAALALVVGVAVPAFAEETTTTTTTTATTDTTTTGIPGKWSEEMKKLIEKHRAFLAAKLNRGEHASSTGKFGASLKGVDASCMQAAVDTREVAIQKAWTTFNTSLSAALTARQQALYSAWGSSTEATARTAAIRSAMKAWKDAHGSAFKALKTDRTAAWSAFRTTAKETCKAVVPVDEALRADLTGSISL